jgi:hypothetical protein
LANTDTWQLRAFLKKNQMPFLENLIDAQIKKRQPKVHQEQDGSIGHTSQNESRFGRY